jgi:hypothetical protein
MFLNRIDQAPAGMEYLTFNLAFNKVRRAKLHGRDYIVAPLTLIVPGVLNGSKGSLYYPADEVSKDPTAWNGVPVVVNHPVINGSNVSARDPEVADRHEVGTVYKSRIGQQGKLQAEAWFDVEKTKRIEPRILANLEAGKPIELSTGLYTENEPAESGAVYNGKPYDFIARNYKPDHLAILPDQTGACSLRDGCGVLTNEAATTNADELNDYLPLPTMNFEQEKDAGEKENLVSHLIANVCCWEEKDRNMLRAYPKTLDRDHTYESM